MEYRDSGVDESSRRLRVLQVVQLETRRFLTQCLTDFEVLNASDHGQAIDVMLSQFVNLVIGEHAPPQIAGADVLWAASQLQPHAKRVLVGRAPDTLVELINQGTVHVHVLNPFVASIAQLLESLIRTHHERDTAKRQRIAAGDEDNDGEA